MPKRKAESSSDIDTSETTPSISDLNVINTSETTPNTTDLDATQSNTSDSKTSIETISSGSDFSFQMFCS
jgi:hypothetical protein